MGDAQPIASAASGEPVKDAVCRLLDARGIAYERVDHPPMATVGDMMEHRLQERGAVAKNLFLRDAKGRRHFLLVLRWDKKADLQAVREQLGSSRLSFASDERLMRYLSVRPGSVSPLCMINDESRAVAVAIDADLMKAEKMGIHPNDNTATVYLSPSDLVKLLRDHGNPVSMMNV